jgi:hypothetical protein
MALLKATLAKWKIAAVSRNAIFCASKKKAKALSQK